MRLGASISIKDNDNRNVLHAIVIHGGELEKFLDDERSVSFTLFPSLYLGSQVLKKVSSKTDLLG